MFKGTIVGIIGKNSMAPSSIKCKRPNGEDGEIHRFAMWVEDDRHTLEDGSHPRFVVNVELPYGDRGAKLVAMLAPGRMVMIEGNMWIDKRTVTREGKEVTYVNTNIHCDQLHFMDSSLQKQIERITKLIIKAELMPEAEAIELSGNLQNFLTTPKESEPEPTDEDKPSFVS